MTPPRWTFPACCASAAWLKDDHDALVGGQLTRLIEAAESVMANGRSWWCCGLHFGGVPQPRRVDLNKMPTRASHDGAEEIHFVRSQKMNCRGAHPEPISYHAQSCFGRDGQLGCFGPCAPR
jgi:hypothetical protein